MSVRSAVGSMSCALAALLALGCMDTGPARVDAPVDAAGGEIAFELAGPGEAALVVPVRINGAGPFDFVLDTGATVTCLDDALAAQLALPEVKGVIGTGAGIGGQGRLRLVRIDSLQIGGITAHELEACVVDLGNLEGLGLELHGLVGLNVLREFRVTLDFQRNVLTLEKPAVQ